MQAINHMLVMDVDGVITNLKNKNVGKHLGIKRILNWLFGTENKSIKFYNHWRYAFRLRSSLPLATTKTELWNF